MQINVAVIVKPFPVPDAVDTDNQRAGTETQITLDRLDAATLTQLCQEFTDSVFKAAGKEPLPTRRSRSVAKREAAQAAPLAKPTKKETP